MPQGARSSAGERCLHTAEVTGSIPLAPTLHRRRSEALVFFPPDPRSREFGATGSNWAAAAGDRHEQGLRDITQAPDRSDPPHATREGPFVPLLLVLPALTCSALLAVVLAQGDGQASPPARPGRRPSPSACRAPLTNAPLTEPRRS